MENELLGGEKKISRKVVHNHVERKIHRAPRPYRVGLNTRAKGL